MWMQETDRMAWPRATWVESAGPQRATEWYACYTRARHEKRVARMLEEREVEGYLPVVRRESRWHDRKKQIDFPLFAGYVFVRVAPAQIYDVTSIPSVVTLVTVNGVPARIHDDEIANIRRFAEGLSAAGSEAEAAPMRTGQRVVVTAGPFREVQGVVVEDRGRARVLVGLPALGQGFSVNIPTDQLRTLDAG